MSLEKLCHEEPDSCYTCCNAKLDEQDCIVCPETKEPIHTLFKSSAEEPMIKEYKRAIEIAKSCDTFKPVKLFDS